MTATTTDNRDFDVQVFTDIVQGEFAGKDALVGNSPLASSGAIMVSGEMPVGGPGWVGTDIRVPYFGSLGEFSDVNEDVASVPQTLSTTNETATIGHSALSFEVTTWAQNSSVPGGDPYKECARQIVRAAARKMDSLCITAAATTPLVNDLYSATTPVVMDWDAVVDSCAKWGDENIDAVGMVVHSRVEAGLRKLRDDNGRPLLLDSMATGSRVRTFQGIPLIVSDRVPLTSSTMTAVTSTGTSPPVATITGTPTGPWNLQIDCNLGGAHATATVRFSTDGGNTWSATLTTLGVGVALPLIDTAKDSLVGNNGTTGLSVAFAAGTFNADNLYVSNAILKATSLIFQPGAMAFWFNRSLMSLQTDKDILKDNDVAAMHMYRVAHLYRRRRGGTKPGVVAVKTNVPGFLPA
jgi:hypothetical protein